MDRRRWVRRFFRRSRPLVLGVLGVALLLVLANLLFWALVAARFAPVEQEYQNGRVLWVGRHAYVFGHGYWERIDGYWQHHTITRLEDGRLYRGSTLDLLTELRRRGARTVWGSWCYSGNFPYIRKDLVTGRETFWPSYASYNERPGQTIPVWLGVAFVRLWWPEPVYTGRPELIRYEAPVTVRLNRPSLEGMARAFNHVQRQVSGLPAPDSVSWRPAEPGRKHSFSWTEYHDLSPRERRAPRALHLEPFSADEAVGTVRYWVRGRAFPVRIRVPAPSSKEAPELLFAGRFGWGE